MRNVQFLDLDMEMQEMDRSTSREHLLIDFSSSDSSDEFDASRKGNVEEGLLSRKISPATSDIGVLPSYGRPSLFDDMEVPLVDLTPGRKVLPLVDLADSEDGLPIKQKQGDTWNWFAPGNIHFTPLESAPASISKSISEPLPITSLPLSMSEGKLIDFQSEHEQEHVSTDMGVQVDNNVPQQELVHVHRTRVDFDAAVSKLTEAVLPDEPPVVRSVLENRYSLDSLVKPIVNTPGATTSDPVPVEIQNPVSSSVQEPFQRGRRVDRHPLEDVYEETVLVVPETVEVGPAVTTGTPLLEDEDHQDLANEHENNELYDHHDDYSYPYDKHHDHDHDHSPFLDTTKGQELQSSSLSPQVVTIPVQAAPAWHWDHEDDPWNGAVRVVDEELVKESERGIEEDLLREGEVTEERGGRVETDEEKGEDLIDVSEMDVGGRMETDEEKGEDLIDISGMDVGLEVGEDETLQLPVELEEIPTEAEDEESYPDPDYLPLPELLLGQSSSVAATDTPLVLVENGPPSCFQEDEIADQNQNDQEEEDLQQQFEKSPRRAAAQMPTPPASPPPISSLRVKGSGGTLGVRSGPPSPNSLSAMGGLLPLTSSSTPQSTSPKLAPLLLLTPPNTSSPSPAIEIQVKVPEGNKQNAAAGAGAYKENESPIGATVRPLWSIRAGDAPALGLAASSLSISTSTSSTGLIPGTGTSMSVSPRTKRRVLGDVTAVVENGGREEKEAGIKQDIVKEDTLKEEKGEAEDEDDEERESSLPGAFPEPLKLTGSSDIDIIAPTITIAALTSTLLSTSIAAASSSVSSTSTTTATSSSTALETSPVVKRRPIVRSPLDIALAMQLRPGLGVGADPAWMVRFLMAMFGWFAILVSGQGEF